jgi:hypothetical protein
VVANRFEIERVAGTGGMGTVYRARDLAAGGAVALKMLSGVGERDATRFAREASVLAELSHPGIVRYIAHGFTAHHDQYIAMEWLEGETLHQRLTRGRIPVSEVVVMARGIAVALAAVHRRGVVHRDLKPMNLMLPDHQLARVKVLDFGIARHVQHAGMLTNTGAVVGTPGYMAPEQVRGETTLDARTDVFALGCVMYRALTGTSAFGGDQSLAVLAKILVDEVMPPSSLEPAVPPALDQLVLRMLAKQPSGRPADGRAVVETLAQLDELTEREAAHPYSATVRSDNEVGDGGSRDSRGAITGTEQRLVSIVFSGPRSHDGGERPAATAAAFGGRMEHLGEGAFLVLFAHADVATDHAARAARCAVALRTLLPGAALMVASGRAAVDHAAVGDVIDRAARAVAQGAGGQILLDETTANLLDDRFVVVVRDQQRILRDVRDVVGVQEPARTLLGRATPMVGRDRELATLEGLWAECTEERVARAVLVTAGPGAGKTRVRQELVRRVLQRDEHAELLLGRGDSLRAGSPFALIADAIRRAAGVRDGDSVDDQRAALHARVQRHVARDEVDRVAHLLGELIGVAFPTDASEALRAARASPIDRGDAMRVAWTDWLAAECAHHPVLLVLEDLHWGDRPTVELVDAALRDLAQAPLMVVALARPEIEDQFPRLWAARALQEIRLPQLTRKACDRLVRDLLGTEVTPDTVEKIVDRAGGNAFFLEELIRAVAEGRSDTLPDSVLSMLQLRLDTLGVMAKRALRAASVFGTVFWAGGVTELLSADPREALDQLVERELIAPASDTQLPGHVEYAFRHDLIREAAFAMTSPEDRVMAHRLAADWLIARGFKDAVALANHLAAGGLPERAAEFYARAAEQAVIGNDSVAAVAHGRNGLASSPGPEVAGRLRIVIAEVHNWRGEHAAGVAAAHEARASLAKGSRTWFRATDEAFYGAGRGGEIATSVSMLHDLTTTVADPDAKLQQLRSVARATIIMLRFGPPALGPVLVQRTKELAAELTIDAGTEQRLHTLRALDARSRGDARSCLAEHAAGRRACEITHNMRELAFNHLSEGGCLAELGSAIEAKAVLRAGIEIAERVGVTSVLPLLWFSLGLCELELDNPSAAMTHAERSLAGNVGHDRPAEGLARWVMTRAALAQDDPDAAQHHLEVTLERMAPFAQYSALAQTTAARLHLRRGELEAACVAAERAISLMRAEDGFQDGESLVRLVHIETLEATGDPKVRAATDAAIARLDARAARIEEPWRSGFLSKPENLATLSRRR